jgi:hypothetical protein
VKVERCLMRDPCGAEEEVEPRERVLHPVSGRTALTASWNPSTPTGPRARQVRFAGQLVSSDSTMASGPYRGGAPSAPQPPPSEVPTFGAVPRRVFGSRKPIGAGRGSNEGSIPGTSNGTLGGAPRIPTTPKAALGAAFR